MTHLVSEVVGELQPGVSHFDLLRACFPAGTVSGAPKVRAMQLISELERHRRGPYAGAVLYALPGEALDACIAIRTIVLRRRRRAASGRRRDRGRLRPGGRARRVPAQAGGARDGDRPRGGARMILLIDNYDSFTYNLAHLFGELGAEVVVRRNDAIGPDEAERLAPSHLVDLPGPGRPADAGACARDRPAARADDADTRRLPRPPGDRRGLRRRGRTGAAARPRQGERDRPRRPRPLPRPARESFEAGRYHSLAATRGPRCASRSRPRAPKER